MESRHCGQDKGIFFCPVHNASTPCSLQAFGIRFMFFFNVLAQMFLLVSCSYAFQYLLCYVHGQGQRTKRKSQKENENL